MRIDLDRERLARLTGAERSGDPVVSDVPLGAALRVAESVAERHGGEVRLRSRADGSLLVELRFPFPAPPA
jgi:hypothetical protein